MITQMSRAWLGAIKQSEIEYPFAVEQLIVNEENDGYDLVYQSKEKCYSNVLLFDSKG